MRRGQVLSKSYLAIQRDDNELVGIQRGKAKLTHLFGPLYAVRIGLNVLRNLGYVIIYHRPKKRHPSTDYFLYHVNSSMISLVEGIKNTMVRGIAKLLPRTRNLCIQIVLRQTPKEGVNLDLFRYVYRIVSVFLTEENETLDVKMEMDFDKNLMRVNCDDPDM